MSKTKRNQVHRSQDNKQSDRGVEQSHHALEHLPLKRGGRLAAGEPGGDQTSLAIDPLPSPPLFKGRGRTESAANSFGKDKSQRAVAAAPDQRDAGDAIPFTTPEDRERFAERMLRLLMTAHGHPERCRERICRRTRRCAGPDCRCVDDFPLPPVSPEQEQENIAAFRRAIAERLAQIEREEARASSPRLSNAAPRVIRARPRADG